ncbi:MAG: nucleotide-diphospho-sugar transferase [Betaproteobacteria bacterium]|nr:nucleotide-diphospho-sugar transferase [Betaproteobacteria bacterium]
MNDRLTTAVLFLVFNRADTTRQVFEAIRQARPARLYVAADGPRVNHPSDGERCELVRQIATAVDWPCELRTLFRETNLGCGVAVSAAIDWFFELEPEGIILEDDCLPDASFFRFCEEMLERYREKPAVMMISGDYYYGRHQRHPSSYFFSRYVGTWGWASWARAWTFNDRTMRRWPELRNSEWLIQVGDGHTDFSDYWTKLFDTVYAGRDDIWDYQWAFSCWTQDGITILPSRNLVKHIGYGSDATHMKGDGGWIWKLPLEAISFPLVHPAEIERDRVADRWMDLKVFGVKAEYYRRILRRIPGLHRVVHQLRMLRRQY